MAEDFDGVVRKLLVAGTLVLAAAMVPTFVTGQAPANQVPVTSVSQSQARSLSNPTSPAWNDASTVTVALSSAPSDVPDANETSIERLNVEAARTQERILLRMSWADATNDSNVTPSRYEAPRISSFGDAAAVQLPANASQRPGIAMGSQQAMVDVWWWNGVMGVQELLAAGPGSTTQVRNSSMSVNATYTDGRWHVVFSRPLDPGAENRASLDREVDVPVSFAVWNGSNTERAGKKAVSEWYTFPFGPEPQGPPYQTVLWTIAGLAIAVVVGVTALAVQRGGS